FGLEARADARPGELSGGERQRVALARTLAAEPRVLLLDEPLAALDSRTRAHAGRELATTLRDVGVPALLVTHDFTEAALLADRVAVIDAGRVVQLGKPGELAGAPASAFVADFTGAVVMNGTASEGPDRLTRVELDGGGDEGREPLGATGSRHRVLLRRTRRLLAREDVGELLELGLLLFRAQLRLRERHVHRVALEPALGAARGARVLVRGAAALGGRRSPRRPLQLREEEVAVAAGHDDLARLELGVVLPTASGDEHMGGALRERRDGGEQHDRGGRAQDARLHLLLLIRTTLQRPMRSAGRALCRPS